MSANLSPVPKLQFFTAAGEPLVGGKLYSYAAGTTTPLVTYTSSTAGTANTNPVILNSRGEAEVWLGGASYKLKLTDANDVEIWTVDNISSEAPLAQLSASNGSSLVGFIQGGTGAQARTVQAKLREVISVTDFGATGDGSTDDTVAIQNAFNYARTRQNAEVYFPPHQQSAFYKTTAPIVIDRAISIRGDSPSTTVLSFGLSSSQYIFDYNCLVADVVEQAFIKGLTLRTDNGAASALRLKNISYVTVKDVRVYNVQHGVIMEGARCFSNAFEELNSYSVSGSTVRFAANFTGGGHFTFLGCTFSGDTGFVLPTTSFADSITMTGCNFEQCVTNSFYIGGSCRGVALLGCRTEGCNGDDFQINPGPGEAVEGITITGTSFTTDAGASRPILLGGAGGTVRGFSITGNQVEYAASGTSFVYLNGDGESGLIAGNYFAQSNTTPINVQRAGVIVFGNENSSGKCAEYWGSAAWGVSEGSFTPVDTSGAGLTLTGTVRYTKIGRVVNWQAYVLYPSTGSTAAASFGGFPFAIGGLGGNVEGRAGAVVNLTNYGTITGLLHGIPSNTSVGFYNPATGAAFQNTNITGKYFFCSGTYMM